MKIVYYVASSLDGYVATSDGGVDWREPFQGTDEDYGFAESAMLPELDTEQLAVGTDR